MARLTVVLGGRAAEELFLNDITVGAENDLLQATDLARRMVTRWGMSELGLASYRAGGQEQPFLGYELSQGRDYSDATIAKPRLQRSTPPSALCWRTATRQPASSCKRARHRCAGW